MKPKIICVDDNPDQRLIVEKTLSDIADLHLCSSSEQFIEEISKNSYDIILLDLVLPDIGGFELASYIHDNPSSQDSVLIIISSKEDVTSQVTAYRLGAMNYIIKPINPRLLKAIVESYYYKKNKREKFDIEFGDIKVNLLQRSISYKDHVFSLTGSEFKILSFLIQREGQIVSRESLLMLISGSKEDISDRVIDTHISSIRKKVKESSINIQSVYGEGYMLNFTEQPQC